MFGPLLTATGLRSVRIHDLRHTYASLLIEASCKGRGFCPSCTGRRMCELGEHLRDGVFDDLPVRQWVLTVPHRLRYAMAWDHRLTRAVLAVFARALLACQRRRARGRGIEGRLGSL